MAQQTSPAAHGNKIFGTSRNSLRGADSSQLHWPRTLLIKRNRPLIREHLRFKQKKARTGILHCFVVDCSGSMLMGKQLALAQGALHRLHQRAYQQRGEIALVTYAGNDAIVQIPPTAARPFNALRLHDAFPKLKGGGATPLQQGIAKADALLAAQRRRKPAQQCWLWLFSDGRSNDFPQRPAHADIVQIVDCENQRIAVCRCRTLAAQWQADYCTLHDLIEP